MPQVVAVLPRRPSGDGAEGEHREGLAVPRAQGRSGRRRRHGAPGAGVPVLTRGAARGCGGGDDADAGSSGHGGQVYLDTVMASEIGRFLMMLPKI